MLDATSIDVVAAFVSPKIHTRSIGADVGRYLALLRAGLSDMPKLAVNVQKGLSELRDDAQVKLMRNRCTSGEKVAVCLTFEITKDSKKTPVSLRAVVARAPLDAQPIDRLFRDGMSLPEVKATIQGELDMVILADEENLAAFLNLCEGKAHLDLLESKEIKTKLEASGYSSPFVVKRFVKGLPNELRLLLTPEITEPEKDVFDEYFALPDDNPSSKKGKGGKPIINPTPDFPADRPSPRIPAIIIETLDDGFRVKANPLFSNWPVNMSVTIAYADGTRQPTWSPFDFAPSELKTQALGCGIEFKQNKLTAKECGSQFSIEVSGFDVRRELDTHLKVWKNA